MPILTRQPEAMGTAAMHLASTRRRGDSTIGDQARPSRDLLPVDGLQAPAPVPAPARALALDSVRLRRQLRDPACRPDRWSEPTFRREIELVRAHLAPLRSRKALAASYGREAFHVSIDKVTGDEPGAVRLAYALRWLELGDGDVSAIWPPAEVRQTA
jgi:hypothetical protein